MFSNKCIIESDDDEVEIRFLMTLNKKKIKIEIISVKCCKVLLTWISFRCGTKLLLT